MLKRLFARFSEGIQSAPPDESLLEAKKDVATNVLHVGVGRGGELCALVKYFPKAHVTGLGTTLLPYLWGAAHPRISVFQCDPSDASTIPWNHLADQYDVIISDAPILPELEKRLAQHGVLYYRD